MANENKYLFKFKVGNAVASLGFKGVKLKTSLARNQMKKGLTLKKGCVEYAALTR
ncbi:hypothetical protein TUM17383_04230 [Shewanella algae]|nr:hypothetical protein TUM17383_04230 [Shewanella algae]